MTEKKYRGGIQRRKVQKYVGGKTHTKANHKKGSQCGNDVGKGDFFLLFFFIFWSALSFLSAEKERNTWCGGVAMN